MTMHEVVFWGSWARQCIQHLRPICTWENVLGQGIDWVMVEGDVQLGLQYGQNWGRGLHLCRTYLQSVTVKTLFPPKYLMRRGLRHYDYKTGNHKYMEEPHTCGTWSSCSSFEPLSSRADVSGSSKTEVCGWFCCPSMPLQIGCWV